MSLEQSSNNSSTPSSTASRSRKQPSSERRIQANRTNAQRSTGPKTDRGKRTVARNALKHGILAREVVITAGDGKESSKDFDELLEQIRADYTPIGGSEELLVQEIATCWFRKRRIIRAENGEIRKQVDTLTLDRQIRNEEKSNLSIALLQDVSSPKKQTDFTMSTMEVFSNLQAIQRDLRGNQVGLNHLRSLVNLAKSEIAKDVFVSEYIRDQISLAFSTWQNSFARGLLTADDQEIIRSQSLKEDPAQVDRRRTDFLDAVNRILGIIGGWEAYAKVQESLALDAQMRSHSLPSVDAADKILRYEAHLDRQLYRAMDQLERLQRQRRGDNVPPPVNVNVGTNT
jgi:hypothetical protein